ncbi:MAG: hypothetical protein EBU93_02925 [Chlamydiae bacterium]|jgi:hypothetical protein|nr:hypothetical protein [Chlamydiota bacterium]
MCTGCWNVKTFKAKKRNNENCDGTEMEVMSLSELKQNLTHEWLETSETHFNVFKKAISDAVSEEITFEISGLRNGILEQTHLHVHLV